MDRPQSHWFFKRVQVTKFQEDFFFDLAGGLAFLLRRFHMIQPEYLPLTGTGTGLFPWTFKTGGSLPAAPRVMSFAEDGTYLYIGTNGSGVWRSGDGGLSWSQKPTGGINQVTQLLVAGPYVLAIGPAGIRKTLDQGDTWQTIPGAPDLSQARSVAYDGAQLYLGTTTTVYWSSDFLGGWTPAVVPPGTFIGGLAAVPGGTVYASSGATGMYKTTDGGQNWASINVGLLSTDCQCVSLAGGVLYCGTNTTGAYKSIDFGANWTQINTGLTDLNVISIDNSTALIAVAGTQTDGFFLTIDGGANWIPYNTGLTSYATAGTFAVTLGAHVYAGTDDGFFMTDFINIIPFPEIGVEFIDGTGKTKWQKDAIQAVLYSAPRREGVIVKTETAPADDKAYGVNMTGIFKPRANTINLYYDVGEKIYVRLKGFQFLNPPGFYCPNFVDFAVEGVYIPEDKEPPK